MNDEYHFVQAYVEWDERHYSLLNDLLLELTSNNIKYVILKNDEGLPFENHSKDVDIVIEPSTYDLESKAFLCKEHDFCHRNASTEWHTVNQ